MRPFFPYYGSKWNAARLYGSPSGAVVEPFAGSAGYSTYHNVRRALLIDADPIIAGLWRYLIRASPEEIRSLPALDNIGDNVDDYAIPQEAKWLIGFWLNRGSATPKKSRTAYSTRTDRGQLCWSERARLRIADQLPLIREWKVVEGDFASGDSATFLDKKLSTTWFVDPPYVSKGSYYRVRFVDYPT